jgi:hypothetical protein
VVSLRALKRMQTEEVLLARTRMISGSIPRRCFRLPAQPGWAGMAPSRGAEHAAVALLRPQGARRSPVTRRRTGRRRRGSPSPRAWRGPSTCWAWRHEQRVPTVPFAPPSPAGRDRTWRKTDPVGPTAVPLVMARNHSRPGPFRMPAGATGCRPVTVSPHQVSWATTLLVRATAPFTPRAPRSRRRSR